MKAYDEVYQIYLAYFKKHNALHCIALRRRLNERKISLAYAARLRFCLAAVDAWLARLDVSCMFGR